MVILHSTFCRSVGVVAIPKLRAFLNNLYWSHAMGSRSALDADAKMGSVISGFYCTNAQEKRWKEEITVLNIGEDSAF